MNKPKRNARKPARPAADFQLVTWDGPTREFRYLGHRDDYSAIYLLDGNDKPLVLVVPVPVGFQVPVKFDDPPARIMETRLLPPPCRPTGAEAELLREVRKMPDGRLLTFHHARSAYATEAAKRNIPNPILPDQWELIHDVFLAPVPDVASYDNWPEIEVEMRNVWAANCDITLQGMVDERAAFTRRHGGKLEILAMVRYRMEFKFKNAVSIWLGDMLGPQAPQNTADLDQINKLLTARLGRDAQKGNSQDAKLLHETHAAVLELRGKKQAKKKKWHQEGGRSTSKWAGRETEAADLAKHMRQARAAWTKEHGKRGARKKALESGRTYWRKRHKGTPLDCFLDDSKVSDSNLYRVMQRDWRAGKSAKRRL